MKTFFNLLIACSVILFSIPSEAFVIKIGDQDLSRMEYKFDSVFFYIYGIKLKKACLQGNSCQLSFSTKPEYGDLDVKLESSKLEPHMQISPKNFKLDQNNRNQNVTLTSECFSSATIKCEDIKLNAKKLEPKE